MALAVLDANVVIAYLSANDASHARAVERIGAIVESGTRRIICAVNLSEVLIGPIRQGRERVVHEFVDRIGIEVAPVDRALAQSAAAVRAATDIALPDAFALATTLAVERSGSDAVQLETFDERLRRAERLLRPRAGRSNGA